MLYYSLSVHATAARKSIETQTADSFKSVYTAYLKEPVHTPSKDSVRLISGCRYKPGAGRSDRNAIDCSIAIIDYDNDCEPDQYVQPWHVHDKLDGIEHAVATTHSNSDDTPKWRLFIPLSRAATRKEYAVVWDYLYTRLLGDYGTPSPSIDTSCKAFSRSYYLPSCPSELDDLFYSDYKPGRPLDVSLILRTHRLTEKTHAVSDLARTGVKQCGQHRSARLLKVVGGMIAAGKSIEQVIEEAVLYDKSQHPIPYFTDARPEKTNHHGFDPNNPEIAARKMVESVYRSHRERGGSEQPVREKIDCPLFA